MFKLLEHGDMFIIFKGGLWNLKVSLEQRGIGKNYITVIHKPFLLYGKHWPEIIDVLRKNMNIDKLELSVFEICESVECVIKAN